MYEPMLWKSYSAQDRIDFLIEIGYRQNEAEDYAYRSFDALPAKVREHIENLEHFDEVR